jgi:hypothetical protein
MAHVQMGLRPVVDPSTIENVPIAMILVVPDR